MKAKEIIEKARGLAKQFRISKGKDFRLKDRDRLRHQDIDQRLGGVNRFTSIDDVIDRFLNEEKSLTWI